MKPLILFALAVEAQGLFDEFTPFYCGVGKVNAAYGVSKAIAAHRQQYQTNPPLIVNLGSAGSSHFARGTVVNCTGFVQRDCDVTALGFPPYTTPYDDTPAILRYGERYAALSSAVCGTGDAFVADSDKGLSVPWQVVDMEAYALAKICAAEDISFACLKHITDGADGGAADDWQATVADTAQVLLQALREHILPR